MATIIRNLITGYKYVNENLADPRTKDYFLIGSPFPGLALLGLYTYFIYNFRPRLMANKQPFKLNRIMQIYNLLQIVLNACLFCKGLEVGREYSYFCEPIDFSYSPKALEVTKVAWIYFMIKLLDLLDTIFYVLRKKQNHITFLHVYHHIGMVMVAWIGTKYLPGGHVLFFGLVNTFVHSIMYTYYFLSSMKIDTSSWKKYITQLQMIQFFLMIIHLSQLAWEDCGFPFWPALIMIPQNIFMIALFGDFYYKTYIKEQTKVVRKKTE